MIDVRWLWLFLDTPRAAGAPLVGVLVAGHRVAAVPDPR